MSKADPARSELPGPRALAEARAENERLEREATMARDVIAAAERLVLSRAGWERWGDRDAFLYDRHKGVGTGAVYTLAEALDRIAARTVRR